MFMFLLICIVVGGVQTGSTRHVDIFNLGLLHLPRVIVWMENLVEWMAGETEVLGENLPRRHFVHHKSHLTRPGIEPGPHDYVLKIYHFEPLREHERAISGSI
jgi:hypothetical protein